MNRFTSTGFLTLVVAVTVSAAEPAALHGTIRFESANEARVPERFRLEPHSFTYTVRPKYELPRSGVSVFTVSFPSPVTSPHPENNTVHAEYFVPTGKTNLPAVLVLDILDGKQVVSRGEAMWLAQNDVAALVVYMAYYGPRRPMETTAGKVRMLSPDIEHSVSAVTQTVLDCRRAAAWLADRPEVDSKKMAVLGTSLGSFVGGVVAAAEPRFASACLLLGGGGLVDAFYDHPKAAPFRPILNLLGGKTRLQKMIAPVDPLTYATELKDRRLLLVAAQRDDVVPPAAMKRLWEATDKPKIVWLDATHVGAAFYAFPAMSAVISHIKDPR